MFVGHRHGEVRTDNEMLGLIDPLRLVELLVDAEAARAVQLTIEYDPQPPFDCGSLAKAGEAVRNRAAQLRR